MGLYDGIRISMDQVLGSFNPQINNTAFTSLVSPPPVDAPYKPKTLQNPSFDIKLKTIEMQRAEDMRQNYQNAKALGLDAQAIGKNLARGARFIVKPSDEATSLGSITTMNANAASAAGFTPSNNGLSVKSSDEVSTGSFGEFLSAGFDNSFQQSLNASPLAGIASGVATGLRGLTEQDVIYTGKTAETLNNVSGALEGINAQINPMGNAANQLGATIGNLIGGTKDRVKGAGSATVDTVSAVASNFGPIGMAIGAALQLANGIGGKRIQKLTDNTGEIVSTTGSAYTGSVDSVSDAIDTYSNKKAGLFDFGYAKKGNAAIDEAERRQNAMLEIGRYQNLRKSNTAAADYAQQNRNRYSGITGGSMAIGKKGLKLPELARSRNLLFKYKDGKKVQETKSKRRTLEELKAYADSVNPRFVQRANDPNLIGINFIDDNGNAAFGTHYMEVGDDGEGNYYVYPRIQEINGMLQFFKDWREALDTALKNKNYLLFDNLEEADNFATNYKKVYPVFQRFQKGGKLGLDTNVIVEGSYHAHKNHLDEINPELEDMTPKGIPVATQNEDGSKTQVAEIERKELILTKELTDKIEALYKDGSEEAMIEAGILFADELFNNTQDNTGEVLNGTA